MIKVLQKSLDNYVKKHNLPSRYIIRYYNTPLAGFGGLVACLIELYRVSNGQSTNVFRTTVKCKTNDIEEYVYSEIIDYLIDKKDGLE